MRKREKDKLMAFRFTEGTKAKLEALADEDRRSMTNLLEVLVDREYARSHGPQPVLTLCRENSEKKEKTVKKSVDKVSV